MAYFNSFIVIKKKHFGIIEEDLSKMNGQVIYNDDYIASLYTGRIPIETDLNKSDFLNISINSNNIDIRINGDLQIKDFVDFKIELFYRFMKSVLTSWGFANFLTFKIVFLMRGDANLPGKSQHRTPHCWF